MKFKRLKEAGFITQRQAAQLVNLPEGIIKEHCKTKTLKSHAQNTERIIFIDNLKEWQQTWGKLSYKPRKIIR